LICRLSFFVRRFCYSTVLNRSHRRYVRRTERRGVPFESWLAPGRVSTASVTDVASSKDERLHGTVTRRARQTVRRGFVTIDAVSR